MYYRIVFLFCFGWMLFLSGGCGSASDGTAAASNSDAEVSDGLYVDEGLDIGETITFNKHIAPIIFKNCSPCHRDESAGPFTLLSFKDVRKRAKMIRSVTEDRYMPPWPADPSYRHFKGERYLSDNEIALIGKWVDNGAAEGRSEDMPELPVFPEGSMLGTPDVIVKPDEVYTIKGDNRDDFLMVKLPFELDRDTFIRAIEFVPDNKKLIHHVNGHIIKYATGAKRDIFGGERIVDTEEMTDREGFKALDLLNDDGTYPVLKPLVANYLPGVEATLYPDGLGTFRMTKKGAILVNDFHYGPTPVDDKDLSTFNIFFAKGPPKRPVYETQLGTLGVSPVEPPLVIPADSVMTFYTRFLVPRDISLLTINPHMHLLGKSFEAYAYKSGMDTIPLIRIPEWDFRWQYFYTFQNMLKVPAGYTIEVKAIFDNTSDNMLNPYDPPRTIAERDGSMKTTDEMLQFIMNYTPYQDGDEEISLEGDEI